MKHLLKTRDRCVTQLAKMSNDSKFVELTADVVRKISIRCGTTFSSPVPTRLAVGELTR